GLIMRADVGCSRDHAGQPVDSALGHACDSAVGNADRLGRGGGPIFYRTGLCAGDPGVAANVTGIRCRSRTCLETAGAASTRKPDGGVATVDGPWLADDLRHGRLLLPAKERQADEAHSPGDRALRRSGGPVRSTYIHDLRVFQGLVERLGFRMAGSDLYR